jgi:hypothetical protein
VSDRSDLVERAAAAYEALADLAETIEDEWQYVADLSSAYLPAIEALAAGPEALPPGAVEAVDEAIVEIGLITDPHRAIDWLSTFPHVEALAVGGDVDVPAAGEADGLPGAERPDDEPDEDSPFRILLGGGR